LADILRTGSVHVEARLTVTGVQFGRPLPRRNVLVAVPGAGSEGPLRVGELEGGREGGGEEGTMRNKEG
jgi:hypothetical protein